MADQVVDDSEFNMWRAIFAMAHADNVVTPEECRFLIKILNSHDFSVEQRATLEEDIGTPQDIFEMFGNITEQKDRSQFFYFARMLSWCDGDFAEAEQKLLTKLAKMYYKSVDFNHVADFVNMELEDEHKTWLEEDHAAEIHKKGLVGIIDHFFHRFKA